MTEERLEAWTNPVTVFEWGGGPEIYPCWEISGPGSFEVGEK